MDDDATAAGARVTGEHDRRARALRIVLGVVGILAVCAATVAITLFATQTRPDASQGRRVDVIRLSDGPLPPGFAASAGARAGVFRGLAVVAVPEADRACLYVVRSDDLIAQSDAVAGPVTSACGAGRFAPTVVIALNRAPEALRARFRDSDALSFTLRGDEVEVRAD